MTKKQQPKPPPTHLCVAVDRHGSDLTVEYGSREQCERAADLCRGWPGYVELRVIEVNKENRRER